MAVILWLIIAAWSFHCMDLFSSDWLRGAFCPILFGIAIFVLLVKLVSRLGPGAGDGFGGDGGDWFDGGGDGGDGGGD
ncbi:hypothetical protein [Thiorhodovibrio frisius]|uniref:Uncharacterized protein n=1 Tax=Thiorhodovibrio frisius TaxID=631362 RepID=H8YW65_9GAMM|nr:hypothetical protein [Thiorhodovibrio frisius]EIC23856.1 hypothetical protein Thi970DRAFT_00371 [Thiorhodovibrio frisius]WPL23234.1 hypothetical protein Thiofri_03419 [Thiorhodovibrio frisius]